jgi:hypothetical protein
MLLGERQLVEAPGVVRDLAMQARKTLLQVCEGVIGVRGERSSVAGLRIGRAGRVRAAPRCG